MREGKLYVDCSSKYVSTAIQSMDSQGMFCLKIRMLVAGCTCKTYSLMLFPIALYKHRTFAMCDNVPAAIKDRCLQA